MATLVSDNFDRANTTSGVGSPQIGPAPAIHYGTLGINGNALYASAVASSRGAVTWDAGTSDVDIAAVLSVPSTTTTFLIILGASATDMWGVGYSATDGRVGLARLGATVAFVEMFGTAPITGSPTIQAVVKSGWIKALVNGVQVGDAIKVPAGATGTLCGVFFQTTAPRVDSLLVQDAGAVTPPAGRDGYLYKGRDTMTEDLGALA